MNKTNALRFLIWVIIAAVAGYLVVMFVLSLMNRQSNDVTPPNEPPPAVTPPPPLTQQDAEYWAEFCKQYECTKGGYPINEDEVQRWIDAHPTN